VKKKTDALNEHMVRNVAMREAEEWWAARSAGQSTKAARPPLSDAERKRQLLRAKEAAEADRVKRELQRWMRQQERAL
jgi:hypothetical protein